MPQRRASGRRHRSCARTTYDTGHFVSGKDANPFLRYRALLSPYRLSRFLGLPEDAWIEIVETLENRLRAINGKAFRVTPMLLQPALAKAIALNARLWVKDETGNVAGSHKARHLMGVMLYLRVLTLPSSPPPKHCARVAWQLHRVATLHWPPLSLRRPPNGRLIVYSRRRQFIGSHAAQR